MQMVVTHTISFFGGGMPDVDKESTEEPEESDLVPLARLLMKNRKKGLQNGEQASEPSCSSGTMIKAVYNGKTIYGHCQTAVGNVLFVIG